MSQMFLTMIIIGFNYRILYKLLKTLIIKPILVRLLNVLDRENKFSILVSYCNFFKKKHALDYCWKNDCRKIMSAYYILKIV